MAEFVVQGVAQALRGAGGKGNVAVVVGAELQTLRCVQTAGFRRALNGADKTDGQVVPAPVELFQKAFRKGGQGGVQIF